MSKSDELEDFEKGRIRRELNTRYTAAERAYIREYLNAQESKHTIASRQRRDSITAKLPPQPPHFPDRSQSLDKMHDEYGHYDHVVVTVQAGAREASQRLRLPTYTTIGEFKAILAKVRLADGYPVYTQGTGQKLYLTAAGGKKLGTVLGQDHHTLAKYAFRREETVVVV